MSGLLFRKESVDAQRTGWLGDISLVRLPSIWILSILALASAVAILSFLILARFSRRTQVQGELVPTQGLAVVLAPATGVITRTFVKEGDHVRSGDLLAVVSIQRATVSDGDTVDAMLQRFDLRSQSVASLKQATDSTLLAQKNGLIAQQTGARETLAQLKVEIGTRGKLIDIADQTVVRMQSLEGDGYVSKFQVDQQRTAKLQAVGAVQELQRQMTAQRSNLAQLGQAIEEISAKILTNRASAARDLALVDQERVQVLDQGTQVVSAPVSGVITADMLKLGQAVKTGQPLLSLLPGDGLLEAQLMVPSSAIGFVKPGDRVLLRYEAFPYQKFGQQPGRINRISRSPIDPGDVVSGATIRQPLYRVSVSLQRQTIAAYGKKMELRPGMTLQADVLGDRRRLIEWAFEPLYSLRGRF